MKFLSDSLVFIGERSFGNIPKGGNGVKRRVLLATLLTLVLTLSCAQAQVSMEASAGYRGTVPGGRWFPLEITITNEDEAFDGVVAVELIRN